MLGLAWLAAAVVLGAVLAGVIKAQPFNIETSVGVLLGIPALILLSLLPRREWDDFLGRLAYPFFLLHLPVFWIWQARGYTPADAVNHLPVLLSWLACTLVASWLLFLVFELPLIRYRHSLRRKPRADD